MIFAVTALEATDSTQTEVKRRAVAGGPEGTVVTARHQRAGRGRRGRDWWDEPGQSLLVSVLLRPTGPSAVAPQLALVAGLAVAEALEAGAGVTARIRWPNDLLVDGRKVCGILAEAASEGGRRLDHVILGIGINLNQAEFPDALRARATSLRLITGAPHEAEALLPVLLECLGRRHAQWQAGGFAALRGDWLARSTVPGQMVRLSEGGEAPAVDVGDDGILIARAPDGRLLRIVSGEAGEEVAAHAARH